MVAYASIKFLCAMRIYHELKLHEQGYPEGDSYNEDADGDFSGDDDFR